jgi:hypothetical protein
MDLVFLSSHMIAWIGHAPPELSASGMSLRIASDVRLRCPVPALDHKLLYHLALNYYFK